MPPVEAGADDPLFDPLFDAVVVCGICDAGRELSTGARCDAGAGREFDARVVDAGRLEICGSRRGAGVVTGAVATGAGAGDTWGAAG
jgi:hypothetical protein